MERGTKPSRREDTPRPSMDVPRGTIQETNEGARGGRAVRQENCHVTGNSGEATVRKPSEFSGAAGGSIEWDSTGSNKPSTEVMKAGRSESTLYAADSNEQQASPSQP